MKTFKKILLSVLALGLMWSCKKDEVQAVLNTGAVPVLSFSSSTVVLTKDNADKDALTLSWAKPDYGFDAAPNYTVLIDKKGGDFTKATPISVGAALSKTFKTSELNGILLSYGFVPGTAGALDFKIQSSLGTTTVFNSTVNTLTATAYSTKLDLSSVWGVVGSAYNNWGSTPDAPFYKTSVANVFVAYVTLTDGEIKFRQDNKWDVNYGGSAGVLKAGGDNIVVKAGTYKITLDATALTYKIELYSWGVVGSAANNWGATPDLPLNYDPTVDLWTGVVKLTDGEIKIRLNNDWGLNYGGANGTLVSGGDNIAVKKGTYLITMDLKTLKYTIQAYNFMGIVGDATATGWGDKPDQKFSFDVSTGTYILSGVVLKAGQIKFRANDDWGVNYGAASGNDGDPIAASGALASGGKNFGVTAGTWDFTLDLKDSAKPTYTAKKR